MRRSLAGTLLAVLLAVPASAETLAQRYEKLGCAVVRIETAEGVGTGFFTDADGTLATAAHVVFTREVRQSGAEVRLSVAPISELTLHFIDGRKQAVRPAPLTQRDADLAAYDLARIETGIKPPCFIPIGSSAGARIGDPVIAIGFPGSSSSGVLNEGFISSLHIAAPTTVAQIKGTDRLYQIAEDLMRVQNATSARACHDMML